MKKRSFSHFLFYTLLLGSTTSYANQVSNTQVANSQEQSNSANNTTVNEAQIWNITPTDWQHYQNLMQGSAGKWYQKLTPAQVLTIYASTPQEQAHYAEIAAKEQHDRVEREIRYAMAIYHAGLKLYPNEPIIKDMDITAFNPK